MVDAPQDVAVLCLRSSHQQDTFKIPLGQSQVENMTLFGALQTELRRKSPTFAVQSLVDLSGFLQGGGRTKPRRQSDVDQSEQTGPSCRMPLVRGGERRGGEVQTYA